MNNALRRKSNIELLRIILMMMVIVLHFNIPSGHAIELTSSIPLNQNILYLLESFCICAVNTFVLITGFFNCYSSKSTLSKAFLLILQVSIYNVITYLLIVLTGTATFSISQFIIHALPNSWFTSIYIALYLLAPYINNVIHGLSQGSFKILLIICFVLFSLEPLFLCILEDYLGWQTSGLSSISIAGAGNGYTLIHFIFMYLIGAYIRIHTFKLKINPVFLYTIFTAFIFIGYKASYGYSEIFYDYCNPFIVLQTIALFLSFNRLNISFIRPINILSKHTFSVYLLHSHFYILFDIPTIVTGSPIRMFTMIILICVTLYIISWIIACIYTSITKPLYSFFSKHDYTIKI